MRVAFLGLGVMGYPMAGHLMRAGMDVQVYNRTAARATEWVREYGGTSVSTPAAAAAGCDLVFACVGNDQDIQAVAAGEDGAFAGMSAGSVFVDHTTTSATMAIALHDKALARGITFIDAPVSGGEAGAINGVLTVMSGGDEAACERVSKVAACYARTWRRLGPVGNGQLTKMVNQICIAGLLQGLSEGLHFAECAGLDPAAVFDVIGGGAAQSWQMDNRSATMAAREFNHGFAVEWMRKDLGFALDEAARNGAALPVTRLVDLYYAEIQQSGGARWDTSSLVTRFDRDNRDE